MKTLSFFWPGMLLVSATAFFLTHTHVVHAGELHIIDVSTPVLRLWKTPDAREVVANIDPDDVPSNLLVEDIAPNKMLKVTVEGFTGYVLSYHVETDEKVEVNVECDSTILARSFAGNRGIGEGCRR